MGLLDGTTQNQYYQGENHGGYQFISLQELIAQFEIAYVGEGKLIPKLNKLDIQFHAMRALQELSFDTFKSFKSQQIDVPPSLIMSLPQDYVNYTKISSVDSAGIKHLLYPVKETNNPFQIKQNTDGSYFFGAEENNVTNPNFEVPFTFTNDSWLIAAPGKSKAWDSFNLSNSGKYYAQFIKDEISLINDELVFKILWENGASQFSSRAYG